MTPCFTLLAAALCGCEQDLAVDLAGAPLEGAQAVVLEVSGLQLLRSDGSSLSVPLDDGADDPVDLVALQQGRSLRLATRTDDFEGDYTGVRPQLRSSGAYVQRADGSRYTLEVVRQPDYAPLKFSLERGEALSLLVTLPLPFSVSTAGDDYELRPVLSAVSRDDAARLGGDLALTLLESDECRAGRSTGRGVALYLYSGFDRSPVDYDETDSSTQRPLAYAPAQFEAALGGWRYSFPALTPGDYTLALTCQADQENPTRDDALRFLRQANVRLATSADLERDLN